jgi:hypothetical protein
LQLQLCLKRPHEQKLLQIKVNIAHKWRNGSGNQHFDVVLFHDAVIRSIPAANVGIDRYLRYASRSSGHTYEVQRCAATFVLDMRQRLFAK